MRRDAPDDGKPKQSFEGSAAESEEPSQTGSMVSGGDAISNRNPDGKERGNLTREEREAKYREARERIFKGFEETEVEEQRGGRNEASKHTSRSSSQTGRGRGSGRRYRNAHDDDGFEARSQFAPYYPQMQTGFSSYAGTNHYGGQGMPPPGGAAHHLSGNAIAGFQASSPAAVSQHLRSYGNGTVTTPLQMYSDVGSFDHLGRPCSRTQVSSDMSAHSSVSGSGYSIADYSLPPFNPAITTPGSFPAHLRQPPYSSTPMGNTQQWPAVTTIPHSYSTFDGSNANTHQGSVDQYNTAVVPMGMPSAYPFGQFPNQAPPHAGFRINYHHPLPGSFNRHALNPQIQPFVPGQRTHAGPPGQYGISGAQSGNGRGGQNPYQKSRLLSSTAFDNSFHPAPYTHHRMNPSMGSNHSSLHINHRSYSPAHHVSTGPIPPHPGSKPENRPLTTEASQPRWAHAANLPPKPPVPALSSQRSINQPRHASTHVVNGSPRTMISGSGMHGSSSAAR